MIDEWAAALEATPLALSLRHSVWLYPLVNSAHILGVALLVGGIVPLDLRLLGLWRQHALGSLWPVLSRTAAIGLVLAIAAGGLLFITRATEYLASGFFLAKQALILIGLINVAMLYRLDHRQVGSVKVKACAVTSLCCWLGALLLGRLVGYF